MSRLLVLPLLLVVGCGVRLAPPRVTAYVFLDIDCPTCDAFAPELRKLRDEYPDVRWVAVYPLHDASAVDVKKHAAENGFVADRWDVRHDSKLELARQFGVTHTPEVVLRVGKDERNVYQGRIDDRDPRPGEKRRAEPTRRDLGDALDDLLARRPVGIAKTEAAGSAIDFGGKP